MVLMKSFFQALTATVIFYGCLFYLQTQGIFLFIPMFYTWAGFMVTLVFVMLNFTLIWNWE